MKPINRRAFKMLPGRISLFLCPPLFLLMDFLNYGYQRVTAIRHNVPLTPFFPLFSDWLQHLRLFVKMLRINASSVCPRRFRRKKGKFKFRALILFCIWRCFVQGGGKRHETPLAASRHLPIWFWPSILEVFFPVYVVQECQYVFFFFFLCSPLKKKRKHLVQEWNLCKITSRRVVNFSLPFKVLSHIAS